MNETLVTIVGNVVSDVRRHRTATDDHITFRVANNARRFDRDTEGWVDGDRLYTTVSCWRRLAAGVAGSLGKGDPVVVTGRLYTRNFQTDDGQRRSVTELEATAVGPDLGRCTASVHRRRRDDESAGGTADAAPVGDEPEPIAAPEPVLVSAVA